MANTIKKNMDTALRANELAQRLLAKGKQPEAVRAMNLSSRAAARASTEMYNMHQAAKSDFDP